MRLTNEMRAKFAADVLKAVPMKHDMSNAKASETITARLYEFLPKEVKAFDKKYPGLVNRTHMSVNCTYTDGTSVLEREGTYTVRRYIRYEFVPAEGSKDTSIQDILEENSKYWDEIRERKELKERIYEQALSCANLKKLQEFFPELVQFMPKQATKTGALVLVGTSNLIAELMQRGIVIKEDTK